MYLLLFSLYWAQGLPVGFMTQALPVILRAEGLSLAHIGGFGLLMLPWSIKIFWAPLVDRRGNKACGHYRSWIIPMQLLTVLVLIGLSFVPIQSLNQPIYLLAFFIGLLCMNTLGATQDVATDGLAVSMLKGQQQSWGNTFQVIGSRLGFIVGGGAMLWALDWLSWQQTFLFLAALVFFNTLPVLMFKEPERVLSASNQSQLSWWQSVKQYLQYFSSTPILLAWLGVLLSFKVIDGLSGPILKPLLVDLGLSYSQIGFYITMLGAVAALIGAGCAGYSLKYVDRAKALLFFSILKAGSLWAYVWLAAQFQHNISVQAWMIYSINMIDDFLSAMLLVVMLTIIMQYSRQQFAATDFTFQVALLATVSGGLYVVSGFLGDWLGYFDYLLGLSGLGLVLLLPIVYWLKLNHK